MTPEQIARQMGLVNVPGTFVRYPDWNMSYTPQSNGGLSSLPDTGWKSQAANEITTNPEGGWWDNLFGKDVGIVPGLAYGIGMLGNIAGGIMNYINGQQALGLARDQFNFQRNLANRNIANQAKLINNRIDTSGAVAAALSGSGGYATTDSINRHKKQAESHHVDGSWVG